MALLIPGTAMARSISLDSSFGANGRVAASLGLNPLLEGTPVGLDEDANGKLVVAVDTTIFRFLPNGELDSSFGEAGTVAIDAAAGTRFDPAGLAVDSKNRIVVAGTSRFQSSILFPSNGNKEGYEALPLTKARVIRYRADGTLDPEFDGDGIIETDFGVPPAEAPNQGSYPSSAVSATGVATDGADRIVVTGEAPARLSTPCLHSQLSPMLRYSSYIARLTPQGVADPSFGEGGGLLLEDPTGTRRPLPTVGAESPLIDSSGRVLFAAGWSELKRCQAEEPLGLIRLDPNGLPDPTFGDNGFSETGTRALSATDSRGRILASFGVSGANQNTAVHLVRLTPAGRLDGGFGRRGSMSFQMAEPRTHVTALTIDSSNGALLVGTRYQKAYYGKIGERRQRPRKWFTLARVTAAGRLDRSFGADGLVTTSFGRPSFAFAKGALIDRRGRAVVAGVYRTARGEGLALVRYRLGRH